MTQMLAWKVRTTDKETLHSAHETEEQAEAAADKANAAAKAAGYSVEYAVKSR